MCFQLFSDGTAQRARADERPLRGGHVGSSPTSRSTCRRPPRVRTCWRRSMRWRAEPLPRHPRGRLLRLRLHSHGGAQEAPYPPLTEATASESTRATPVGSERAWCWVSARPTTSRESQSPVDHLHFLNQRERTGGGHVLDFVLEQASSRYRPAATRSISVCRRPDRSSRPTSMARTWMPLFEGVRAEPDRDEGAAPACSRRSAGLRVEGGGRSESAGAAALRGFLTDLGEETPLRSRGPGSPPTSPT